MNEKKTYRILAENQLICNDTWETGLNNNDLIIGPSGAGKTRGYVKPNIMQGNESMIVADTKGNLVRQVGPLLEEKGYKVHLLDLKHLANSTIGFNPFDFIGRTADGGYRQQDVITISATLVPKNMDQREPFWEDAARMYLNCLIFYMLECLPPEEHHLGTVAELFFAMAGGDFKQLIQEREVTHPGSAAVRTYKLFRCIAPAEKMDASILGILGERFNGLLLDDLLGLYQASERVDFRRMGLEKTALFLNISDTDRSMDRIASLIYTQGLHELCESADTEYDDQRLPVPVRFILDDFAANAYIPDFDNITSIIRSREISVSIILQSITQLQALYGPERALTIVNNCDNWLYLGGQDCTTAAQIAEKADKRPATILNMPLTQALLLTRGQRAREVRKYDITSHADYARMAEGSAGQPSPLETAVIHPFPEDSQEVLGDLPF